MRHWTCVLACAQHGQSRNVTYPWVLQMCAVLVGVPRGGEPLDGHEAEWWSRFPCKKTKTAVSVACWSSYCCQQPREWGVGYLAVAKVKLHSADSGLDTTVCVVVAGAAAAHAEISSNVAEICSRNSTAALSAAPRGGQGRVDAPWAAPATCHL